MKVKALKRHYHEHFKDGFNVSDWKDVGESYECGADWGKKVCAIGIAEEVKPKKKAPAKNKKAPQTKKSAIETKKAVKKK